MREERNRTCNLNYKGKDYYVTIHSIRFSQSLMVTKFIINSVKFWILQKEHDYRMIGEFPRLK